ncbi:MAG: prepilin-type N-terminal cleavage/methylation domain-containing protein [Pseudomonadota bacterium]
MPENSTNIQCLSLMKGHNNTGFTLVELLVVIAVLAILVTAVLPFGGRMMDQTKKDKTVQLLESIRFGLIGAEYAYDANGNRVIGGYIGDFGELPDLIVHVWDTDNKAWLIRHEEDNALPDLYDTTVANDYDKFNQNAMPLALWTNFVSVNGTYQSIVDKDDWHGPYVVQTRDDFTNDDDVFTYTAPSSSEDFSNDDDVDENRKFWLRQGGGRLIDGWGSALLFYMDDEDLYVVSAGSDRRINYGDYYLIEDPDSDDVYDNGPADTSLSGNEDNIVMVLTKEQWDLTNQKATITRLKLQDLKAGIIGQRGHVTGGVKQPNGFVADIGGLETLVGSYVYKEGVDTHVYKCILRHESSSSEGLPSSDGGDNAYWEGIEVDDLDTSIYTASRTADYPFATMWQEDRTYYEAQPHLLLTNADYVYTEDDETGDITYYRYVSNEDDTTSKPTSSSTEWAEDDTFAGQEWVLEHKTSTTYTSEILNPWTYYSSVEFGAGWRGPYTSYTSDPLTDGWGREIVLEMDKGSLVLRSYGPDGLTGGTYEDDDITETIAHSDYAVPATVKVYEQSADTTNNIPAVSMASSSETLKSYVSVYSAFNGGVGYFNALIDNTDETTSTTNGVFYFTSEAGHESGPFLVDGGSVNIVEGLSASNRPTGDGVWIPIGKVMVVFRHYNYLSYDDSTTSSSTYASPDTSTKYGTSGWNNGTYGTLGGYQRTFLIHSRTNPELVLGEE